MECHAGDERQLTVFIAMISIDRAKRNSHALQSGDTAVVACGAASLPLQVSVLARRYPHVIRLAIIRLAIAGA